LLLKKSIDLLRWEARWFTKQSKASCDYELWLLRLLKTMRRYIYRKFSHIYISKNERNYEYIYEYENWVHTSYEIDLYL